jgi:hypothetical protein
VQKIANNEVRVLINRAGRNGGQTIIMEFDFHSDLPNGRRSMEFNFIPPEPGVLITKLHIGNALTKNRKGQISDTQLIE